MLRSFLISLPLVLGLDFLWLGFVVKDFNLRQLGSIGRVENGNFQLLLGPAAGAYVLMAASLALFSVPRAAAAASGWGAFGWGAALGLVIYGIYDLTNLAILKGYPAAFAAADMAWGTVLYATVTWIVGWKLGGFKAS